MASNVKYILTGNPEVKVPDSYETTLSWIDLTTLSSSQLILINLERTHNSTWLVAKDLHTCTDENGNEIPNPAGLAYTDYSSLGRGKYNLDPSVFAKFPNDKWALHDPRTVFTENTIKEPLADGGGSYVKRAS